MTDLERHWDDLPVGPAPLDAIVREGRRQAGAARRRPVVRLRRSLGVVTVLGGVAAAFVAGTVVDQPRTTAPGGAEGAGGTQAPLDGGSEAITPAAFQGELQAPASCDELLGHYVGQGADLVSEYGWGGVEVSNFGMLEGFSDAPAMPQDTAADSLRRLPNFVAGALATTGAYATDTGTTVQEQGVDEPDGVKTTGTMLVRLREATLTTYDVTGAEVRELGRLDLGDFHDGEILLAGDTVVALGNDGTPPPPSSGYYGYEQASPQTRVLSIDLTDPTAPTLERTVDYDAELVAARQHGDDVRLVLSKGLPDLAFDDGPNAQVANRALVEETTIEDWLPRMSVDGGEPTDLLDCDRVAIPRADIGLATMAVVGFASAATDEVESLGLAGDAPLTYESADHLYLASSGGSDEFCFDFCPVTRSAGSGYDGTTHVYDFALDGTGASYVGAGEVEGTVRDRWSLDEYDGVLRVAVGPSSETGNYNSIVTLRAQGGDGLGDQGGELVEVGRLDDLGVGEDIKSVRWFEGLALVVTFRQIDPLYAVDLTDATDPTLLSELKIPGFSSYLHPLGTMRVVGVGSDGRSSAQAGLFDVTDLTDVRRLDVTTFGRGTYAQAGDDPRQFTWLPDERIVLTVIARGRAGFVSRIQLDGGQMTSELTKVEYGADVDAVRLVPLLGGKVALVTGEDVEFFPLD